ncbi:SDR family oxidoreductase [Leptospira fluminis]|uniref:SDR family oxidoreductase n=1 Tax=Leptospira fluminis TaxID=2484979 RepID=A0A4R9GQF8_9LEPT|nr:SDR family oxidoreductase [Leptospira fluminis]TGK19968.1 SDR family oxidoreductase [Leptospira fluminis]
MKKSLEFDSILVTGGSGGLGRTLVHNLSEQGYRVWNLDRNPPANIEPGEVFLPADLTSADRIGEACKEFLGTVGEGGMSGRRFCGLVHCAGYGGPYQEITKVSLEEWDIVFSVNIRSAFQITREILPFLAEQKYGRLVYVGSTLSRKGGSLSVAYSSSKHALVGFVKSIAAEWGKFGVTANSVSPGYMNTGMGVREDQVDDHRKKIVSMTPSGTIAEPEEIARVISFLLQPESGYINGADWAIDGGITAI